MSAPYSDGVTTPYPYQRQRAQVDTRLVRDVSALALVLLGSTGLITMAFVVDWRLGVAVLSALMVAAGVYLGYDRG